EIAHEQAARRRRDRDVVSRHHRIDQDEIVGRRGADRDLLGTAFDRASDIGTFDHREAVARKAQLACLFPHGRGITDGHSTYIPQVDAFSTGDALSAMSAAVAAEQGMPGAWCAERRT